MRWLLVLCLCSCDDEVARVDAPVVPDAPRPPDARSPDATVDALPEAVWQTGALPDPPPRDTLLPLPGEGAGPAVVTSNNPEAFEGTGLLFGTGRASDARGGGTLALQGDFGVYLHHVNQSGAHRWLTVMVTNPGSESVVVSARGSGYTQTETGGLGLGMSPDFQVSEDWILDAPDTIVMAQVLESQRPTTIFQKMVSSGAEVDGRFQVNATGPVFTYVVVTDTPNLNDAISVYQTDAPGTVAVSGAPPPPFGREAGVYAHDTWRGEIVADVPYGPAYLGFMVNTASGGGLPQVQAFPALLHYGDSAAESVGMYGNVYELSIRLRHDGINVARGVRIWFASLVEADLSRYWDGVGVVDGSPIVIRHTPATRKTLLIDLQLAPGEERVTTFRAMVPGLTSIPQALYLESY